MLHLQDDLTEAARPEHARSTRDGGVYEGVVVLEAGELQGLEGSDRWMTLIDS